MQLGVRMVIDKVYINGLSVIAPGLVEHEAVLKVLRNEQEWIEEPLPKLIPSLLPANERRRTTPLIKIALKTIQPLLKDNDDLNRTTMVFASSDGDLDIDDKICKALSESNKVVSPTQFHNSVHNAPAGYWAIAASMRSPSISLSAGDGTFSAGLIDAVTHVINEQNNVLMVAYDVIAPELLDSVRHFEYSLGVALRLGVNKEEGSLGSIRISIESSDKEISRCENKSLEPLRMGNPIGISLPLLEMLSLKATSSVTLPYIMGNQLRIDVSQ